MECNLSDTTLRCTFLGLHNNIGRPEILPHVRNGNVSRLYVYMLPDSRAVQERIVRPWILIKLARNYQQKSGQCLDGMR